MSRVGQIPTDQCRRFCEQVQLLYDLAIANRSLVRYADSWIVDLTFPSKTSHTTETAWAGSPSNRASNQRQTTNHLAVRRLSEPGDNDMSHSELKSWVPQLEIIQYMKSFGDVRKMTVSCLEAGGWWPSHYDFSHKNGHKLNLVVSSNPLATTLVWNSQQKKLNRRNLEAGEIWHINVGMKHSAHNWGDTPRVHFLASYKTLNTEIEHGIYR